MERVYKTAVVTVAPQATVLAVARLMRRTQHVGSVIVKEISGLAEAIHTERAKERIVTIAPRE